MQYLQTYLSRIIERGNVKLAESILQTADDIGERQLKKFSFTTHEIGLLFGNVQSGKTGQMFGIMCKAADLGFPAFVLLTTDNVVLQQQTLARVHADLDGFCICGENDVQLFMDNSLIQPVIVVLKKNARVLKLWSNVLASSGFMKGNPLFVVDDEADAASLNTLVNRQCQSSINKYLDAIKNETSSSLYLQVTGTPQAILLQTAVSGWRPRFVGYFKPGDGYLGGDFFFPVGEETAPCVSFLETMEMPMRTFVVRHIVVSAQIFLAGGRVSNALIHPSVRQSQHTQYADAAAQEIAWCKDHSKTAFVEAVRAVYEDMNPQKSEKQALPLILAEAQRLIREDSMHIIIMNGAHEVDSVSYAQGCNLIIGGNTLGRGVTFPALHSIYYTRTSKKPQADTIWQHSRMFGYDRDAGLVHIYMDRHLYKLFADINASNNAIAAQIERGIENIRLYYAQGIRPTRANVLDQKRVEMIVGGTNYYPYRPNNDSIEGLSALLARFANDEPYYQINLRFMQELLSHIIPSADFKLDAFQSILRAMLSERPTAQGILIVRRGRDVAQGTGALLSPNDWKLGASFSEQAVLTMYQVTGTKGWGGRQLWIPNIRLPDGMAYYNVHEDITGE